jgi:predicted DNA-binding protein YlxM (UPF0122 family)
MGRYSNPDIVSRLQRILAGNGRDRPSRRPVPSLHQKQHRLTQSELRALLASYEAGTAIARIATDFAVHRTTVLDIVRRAGLKRRYRRIDDALENAQALYESGLSLKQVGEHFGVSPDAVRDCFIRNGLPIRPRPGWPY